MSGKLTRDGLKGLTAEQKIEYQRKQNAARVAAYRAANKEKAAEYNRTYKIIISIDRRTDKNIWNKTVNM